MSSHNYRPCPIAASTPADSAYFVGFHDICPFSPDNSRVALHRLPADVPLSAHAQGPLDICLWGHAGTGMETVGRTTTWSWEQGARLQWLPGKHAALAYNTLVDGQPGSEIVDVLNGGRRTLPFTIYSISPDGRTSLSPHFGRLGKYWASYGYAGLEAPGLEAPRPDNDGIHLLDLQSGDVQLIVSIARAAATADEAASPEIPHFLAHPTWNPSGTRFVFMHRFITADRALYSRLLAANADGSGLRVLASEKCSHFVWLDDDSVMVWTRFAPKLGAAARRRGLLAFPLLRPIVRKLRKLSPHVKQRLLSEYYYIIPVDDPDSKVPLAPKLLEQDGHPMFSSDRRWLLTDTYPDSGGFQTLILYDMRENQRHDVARLAYPDALRQAGLKCDLHPRWDRNERWACVDSAHTGTRGVHIVDLSRVLQPS